MQIISLLRTPFLSLYPVLTYLLVIHLSSSLPVRMTSGYHLKTFKAVNVSPPHMKYNVLHYRPCSPSFLCLFVTF